MTNAIKNRSNRKDTIQDDDWSEEKSDNESDKKS